jgi:hypothetical protein
MIEAPQSESQPLQIQPVSEWLAQTLRLTAFTDPQRELDPAVWWDTVFGEEPESVEIEPRKRVHKQSSPYENGEISLVTQPLRIDWLLTSQAPSEIGLPNLGKYLQSLDSFRNVIARWFGIEDCPALMRLAFGAVLQYPVPTREHGYRQLQPYLHDVRLDPEGSTDFQYRINRPRQLANGIPGLRVNRLTNWSVIRFLPMTLEFGPTGIRSTEERQSFACRLELDINTAPEFEGQVAPGLLPGIFDELVSLGREILENGDIP